MIRFDTELKIDVPIVWRGCGYASVDCTDKELAAIVHKAVQARYVAICQEARDIHDQEILEERFGVV